MNGNDICRFIASGKEKRKVELGLNLFDLNGPHLFATVVFIPVGTHSRVLDAVANVGIIFVLRRFFKKILLFPFAEGSLALRSFLQCSVIKSPTLSI